MTRQDLIEALERGERGAKVSLSAQTWAREQGWSAQATAMVFCAVANGSVNAALSLMNEVLPGWGWHAGCTADGYRFDVEDPGDKWERSYRGIAPTPAAALIAAILKAEETKDAAAS